MNEFTDTPAKAACQELCDKRNAHISKTHPMRWKPLWTADKGWHPELRPRVEREVRKPKKMVQR